MDNDDNGGYFRRSGSNFTTNIMITAIVCLFFVVAVMVALHMYARYVFRRQERRREELRRSAIANAVVQSSEQPRTGLDAGVIATLPIFIYSKGANDVQIECSVCLSNLEEGEMARLLPNCKHTFHSQCIDTWLRAQSTCPICRTEATPRPQSTPIGVGLVVPPTAPPVHGSEGTSDDAGQSSKPLGSSSRFSFRRILSRDRSSHRVQPNEDRSSHRGQPNDQADTVRDLEGQ